MIQSADKYLDNRMAAFFFLAGMTGFFLWTLPAQAQLAVDMDELGACKVKSTEVLQSAECYKNKNEQECNNFCSITPLNPEGIVGYHCWFYKGEADCPALPLPTLTSETSSKKAIEIPVIHLQNPLRLGSTKLPVLLGRILDSVLGVIGALALAAFVFGGFMWLTSAGSEDKVKKGTESMMYAIIGLFIIFAAYGILSTVIRLVTGSG